MRISDWSSDVCSSDLFDRRVLEAEGREYFLEPGEYPSGGVLNAAIIAALIGRPILLRIADAALDRQAIDDFIFGIGEDRIGARLLKRLRYRSEEHTSELQSLMRISYAVFCLKKK